MYHNKNSKYLIWFAVMLYTVLALFWLYASLTHKTGDYRLAFGATYGLMALTGAVVGFSKAGQWGGRKSTMGLTILFLAIGLAFAEFGQLVFSYYNIVKQVEIPYPSLADVGFFGSIPLYILGALYLGHTSGVKLSLKKPGIKLVAVIVPALLVFSAYHFFLKGYDFKGTSALQILLDFGYPIGQAIYVAVAVFVFLAVNSKLGGLMRSRILLVLVAFVAQFVADFNFLYQNSHDTWVNGGYGDMLYLTAYFVMTISLIRLCAPITSSSAREVT